VLGVLETEDDTLNIALEEAYPLTVATAVSDAETAPLGVGTCDEEKTDELLTDILTDGLDVGVYVEKGLFEEVATIELLIEEDTEAELLTDSLLLILTDTLGVLVERGLLELVATKELLIEEDEELEPLTDSLLLLLTDTLGVSVVNGVAEATLLDDTLADEEVEGQALIEPLLLRLADTLGELDNSAVDEGLLDTETLADSLLLSTADQEEDCVGGPVGRLLGETLPEDEGVLERVCVLDAEEEVLSERVETPDVECDREGDEVEDEDTVWVLELEILLVGVLEPLVLLVADKVRVEVGDTV
jgi:hypothetical protein